MEGEPRRREAVVEHLLIAVDTKKGVMGGGVGGGSHRGDRRVKKLRWRRV